VTTTFFAKNSSLAAAAFAGATLARSPRGTFLCARASSPGMTMLLLQRYMAWWRHLK
jgi:hypothetical protein